MVDKGRARVGVWVAIALLCVAALVFEAAAGILPETAFFKIGTWQRLVTLVGLVAVVMAGARWRHFRTRLDIPIVVLGLAASMITVRMGTWPQWRHFVSYVAVYYLVVALIRLQKASVRAMVTLAATAVTVASAVALSQYSGDVPTGFCRTETMRDISCNVHGVMYRAIGTFSNPNLLAAFLLLFAPLGVLAAASVKDRLYRICSLGLTVMAYLAVGVTFSRAAYIAAFIGILVLVWQLTRGRLSARAFRLVSWAGLALLGIALGTIAAMSQAGNSLGIRSEAWKAAIAVAADHPFGVGLGRAGDAVNARLPNSPVHFQHAHNLWLNWLAETGVAGFIAMLAITVGVLAIAIGLARRGRAVGVATLAGLAGYLTMNLTDHPSNLGRIAIAMWFVFGVVAASTSPHWRRRTAPAKASSAKASSTKAASPKPVAKEPAKEKAAPKAKEPAKISGELDLDDVVAESAAEKTGRTRVVKERAGIDSPTERIALESATKAAERARRRRAGR